MKAEYIAKISEIVESVRAGEVRGVKPDRNHVMDPRYGKSYIVPIPEDYITLFVQVNNMNEHKYDYLIDDMFHDVVIKNPDLREFIDVPERRRFDICMGAASWLKPHDIEYYITHPYNKREAWATTLQDIAKNLYGDKHKINSKGYVEWLHFVLSPETSLAVIVDHVDKLEPYQARKISDIVSTHPVIAPLKLHSVLNK